jgi:branched-chain amino acid transport system substrate-binding protein
LAIQQANDTGGINGRGISVITVDDAYDPARAERNVRDLDDKHRPVALMGAVGVPVIASILPTVEALRIPVIGLSSCAPAVRTPSKRYVFPVRASYRLEGEHTVRHLKTIGITRIAIFRQSDPFGTTVAASYEEATRAAGIEI